MSKKNIVVIVVCIVLLVASVGVNLWLFSSLNQVNDAKTSLEETVSVKNSEIDSLSASINAKDSEIQSLQSEKEQIQTQVSNLEGENTNLQNQIDFLETEKASLENTITSLESQIDELNQPRILNTVDVDGYEWTTTSEGERWQETVSGTISNYGPGSVLELTLTIRWYLDGEFLYIRELYYPWSLDPAGGTWTIDEIFQFEQQPDYHELELDYRIIT
jgi:cell division protein FtsB